MIKMNIRDKFLKAKIPYDDIDPEMIELLDILNFKLGLKTQFCCYGHKNGESVQIIFDNSVKDKEIYNLAKYICGIYSIGEFNKWIRSNGVSFGGKLLENWVYEINPMYNEEDVSVYEFIKKEIFKMLICVLNKYKN